MKAMKKSLKWIGICLGTLLGLVGIAEAAFYDRTSLKPKLHDHNPPEAISISTVSALIQPVGQLAYVPASGDQDKGYSGKLVFTDPLSDKDLTDIIAFMKTLTPAGKI